MTPDHEQTILDSARYLRSVRTIDPDELSANVGSAIAPGEVAQILRKAAVDIGLIERPDGTFSAASSDPVSVDFDGVEAIPPSIVGRIESTLTTRYGKEWAAGATGDELRASIRRFKAAYFSGQAVTYDRTTALGYAIYHLPASFASVQYVFEELVEAGLIPGTFRLLDVGAGVGGQALGLDAYLPRSTLVEYVGVEPSDAAADLLSTLLAGTGPNFHTSVRRSPVERVEIDEPYDLILCANVVSELDDPVGIFDQLVTALDPAGTIVVIEPADERTSRGLRRIEREACAASDLAVFSPTLRLWPDMEPTDDCWSFDVKPDVAIPGFQRKLDEAPRERSDDRSPATGEFINDDVQYAYSILRRDEAKRIPFEPSRSRYRPLSAASEQITDRVAVAAVKLSHSLVDDPDANDLFVLGDGSQDERWYAVLTAGTRLNRQLVEAAYGDVLLIEGGLVLWNRDEGAVNLVVDDKTVVDRITPPGSNRSN